MCACASIDKLKFAGKIELKANEVSNMSKRRQRSEASEDEVEEYPAKKRKTQGTWTVPLALNKQVLFSFGVH